MNVISCFRDMVARSGDAVALDGHGGSWSYGALERATAALARGLQAQGVRPGDTVAFALERSPEAVVLHLAVLAVGAVYAPLDPASPPARWERMLRLLGRPHVVSTDDRLADIAQRLDLPQLSLTQTGPADAATDPFTAGLARSPHDAAYVMFTSGSTGEPKGVMIPHRGIVRLVHNVSYARFGPGRALLHIAPLSFDATTLELWAALLTGGRCVLHHEPLATAAGIGESIRTYGVTTMWLTAGLFNAIIDEAPQVLRGLDELLIGGETLSVPHVRRALDALPDTTIINGYGPTECTTFATTYPIPRPLPAHVTAIPIGTPIERTTLTVCDRDGRPVADGEVGELIIGGDGVGLGYVGGDAQVNAAFETDPHAHHTLRYRTGDRVRRNADGLFEFVGRDDPQLKMSGHRIEPAEIERVLAAAPGVAAVAVVAAARGTGATRLVAFLVAAAGSPRPDVDSLRALARAQLPAAMVPAEYRVIDQLPLTANGKVNRRALVDLVALDTPAAVQAPSRRTDASPTPDTAAQLETRLRACWEALLGVPVAPTANLFDLGASSLLVIRAVARLAAQDGLVVPAIAVFEHPTVRTLARALAGETTTTDEETTHHEAHHAASDDRRIAIVGAAVRYPGAPTLAAFWERLQRSTDAITRFDEHTLDADVSATERAAPGYVAARGVLDDIEQFDAPFFGISPREAQLTDPQQRLWLELAWEALEDAGHITDRSTRTVGVFGGVYNATYLARALAANRALVQQYGEFNAMLLNEKDYVAPRVAHRLGLRGPAISIHTACSTSLVAVCQAVQALRDGHCDMALAGGVSITLPVRSGYQYLEGGMLSPDGVTRPFDVQAAGTVFSDGAGVVVLKRLADAERDGDQIYAVIRGVGVNNDGAGKASFTAPSVTGQVEVVRRALRDAGVSASAVSFVEAHGTATPLGDPIEVEALRRVFVADDAAPANCRLGSIKGHLGHTVIGAGVAGLLKTALALRHEQLPGTAHFTAPHAALQLEGSPFRVHGATEAWPRTQVPRLAGVSSFGVGGTNAHVILEEAPARDSAVTSVPDVWPQLLPISARSAQARDDATGRLHEALSAASPPALSAIAHTLQVGREAFTHRRVIVARTISDANRALATAADAARVQGDASSEIPEVAFLFPGQGAQSRRMGRALHEHAPVFRDAFDRCAAVAASEAQLDLRAAIDEQDAEALSQTAIAQPALFATSFALASLWQSWGVHPTVLLGHSVGEFVAAALAGVFSVEDGMRLVCARGRAMQALPPGRMLAVAATEAALRDRLDPALSVAAVNAPDQCVISGPAQAITALQALLETDGIMARPLATSHAFHSAMMDPVLEAFGALVRTIALHAPATPIISTVTGTRLDDARATDPAYWTRHLRETVRFGDAAARLIAAPNTVLLEVGPGGTLSRLAKRQGAAGAVRAVASLGADTLPELEQIALAAGQLWCWGRPAPWPMLRADAPPPARCSLPTYPFERQRCWVDPAPAVPPVAFPSSMVQDAPSSRGVAPAHAPLAPTGLPVAPSLVSAMSAAPEPRRTRLHQELRTAVEEVSGVALEGVDPTTRFTQIGLDSLVLTQLALAISRKYGVKIAFRQLLESLSSVHELAEHLDRTLPPEVVPTLPLTVPTAPAVASVPQTTTGAAAAALPDGIAAVFAQQLRLMQQQLDLLAASGVRLPEGSTPLGDAPADAPAAASPAALATPAPAASATEPELPDVGPARALYDASRAFGAAMRVTVSESNGELSPRQRSRLDAFIRRYTARTAGSKRYTAQHRDGMADPRAATGFRPLTKELVYPIVVQRSSGARVWDVDGNEYIDVLSGFGSNLLGWTPPVIVNALREQLDRGFEVGPQHALVGEVAERLRAITGAERVAFCNTGSEAVLGAIRIARTVTGRPLVAMFTGSYHGINDEVIVRGRADHRAMPAAPGIMPEATRNVLMLEYGTAESLAILEARADEIAAVLVEPVQSRRPDLQPREFLAALRELTTRTGMVYIWDEIVTGFRAAPGGAQEYFGIRADLATYGKIVGGGLPIGVIAGTREFMDALDGGAWHYGDGSVPEVGVTYFAGTFVRHPLALASARATLDELARRGPSLQTELAERTARLAAAINTRARALGVPLEVRHFTSVWKTFMTAESPHTDLLFYALRERGLHIYDGFPCFMTAAHGDAECEAIVEAFAGALEEMVEGRFLPVVASAETPVAVRATRPLRHPARP